MDDDVRLSSLALTHGQARWVLQHLGLRAGDDEARLDSWLKYARRMGVPFPPNELGRGTGVNVTYRYSHLMELATALALRAQGILPHDLLGLLIRDRERLRRLYARAWRERESGLGAPIDLRLDNGRHLRATGTYLHLGLDYTPDGILFHIEPELIGPWEALQKALAQHINVYPRPPLPISSIAANLVDLAEGAPDIRRGRP